MEASPTSSFIMVETEFLFQVLVIALNASAQFRDVDQRASAHARGTIGSVTPCVPTSGRPPPVWRPVGIDPRFPTRVVNAEHQNYGNCGRYDSAHQTESSIPARCTRPRRRHREFGPGREADIEPVQSSRCCVPFLHLGPLVGPGCYTEPFDLSGKHDYIVGSQSTNHCNHGSRAGISS
jgi:hypothetical protein